MAGGDENSVKDTQPVFMQLRKIAEDTGAAIIVIHHVNKMGGYRGSTAIPGAIDNMVLITSDEDSNLITFKSLKVRDGVPFEFSAKAHRDEDRFWLTVADPQEIKNKEQLGKPHHYVMHFLEGRDGEALLTAVEENADRCKPQAAKSAVYDLVEWGYLFRSDGGGRGTKATYKLTEKGQKWTEAFLV